MCFCYRTLISDPCGFSEQRAGTLDIKYRQILLRRSQKCFSQSEAKTVIFAFQLARKHKYDRGPWVLASGRFFKFRSAIAEEKSKMSQLIRDHGGHLYFRSAAQKHKLGRGRWVLASCQDLSYSVRRLQRSGNVSANQSSGWPSSLSGNRR